MEPRISEEESDVTDGSTPSLLPDGKRRLSPDTTTVSSATPHEEPVVEDDEKSFEGDSDFDSEEERDEFSISLHGGEDDTASVFSAMSSVATDDQSFSSRMDFSAASGTEGEVESQQIAKKETTAVRWGRCGILGVLLVLTVLIPFFLFRVAKNEEEDRFKEEFADTSEELVKAWESNILQTLQAVDGLMTNIATANNNTPETDWPFVTIDDFLLWSDHTIKTSQSLRSNALVPTVTETDRTSYEQHVESNQDWMNPSNRRLEFYNPVVTRRYVQGLEEGQQNQLYEYAPNGDIVIASGPEPYGPIRHVHPVDMMSINYNLRNNTVTLDDIVTAVETPGAVLGRLLTTDQDSLRLLVDVPDEGDGDLYGSIVYPVFNEIGQNGAVGDAVGVLVSIYSMSEVLAGTVPSHVKGITAVFENSCGQVATFELNGEDVQFVGYSDEHDRAYTSYRKTFDLVDLSLQDVTASGTSIAESSTTCALSLSVYPSEVFEEEFKTPFPATLTGLAVLAFVLVFLLFLVYDFALERRNRALLQSALEARAIVSSLFPANVRDRLFETNREKEKNKKNKKKLLRKKRKKKKKDGDENNSDGDEVPKAIGEAGVTPTGATSEQAPTKMSPSTMKNLLDSVNTPLGMDGVKGNRKTLAHPKHRLKTFLANTPTGLEDRSDEFGLAKPIADLFPHTTVLFADIVGFTAWSSEREPEDVFTLLQTIYHSFDRIAKRRGVFKVETIGDCYVAVTGLPDPQPDHAVRMTKFARECMTKMNEVTKKLELSLGPDTGDLCMRLGLNSGPVTAGVLQGEKSRFQLFGDTVNTASRMESTGEMNRVHLSKSTADLLIEAGKTYWVKPRDDMVHAKGKGNVQTYWLVSRSENFSIQANRSSDALETDIRRIAPSRTKSAFGRGEPIRGVKRTTSDSIQKVDRLSDIVAQGRESNDMREERLVQWQVELFVRLLKKIVAARDEKPVHASKSSSDGWGAIPKSSSHSISTNTQSTVRNEPLNDDRFSRGAPGGQGGMVLPRREPSFRMPTRRLSVDTGLNASVSTLNSIAEPDPDRTVVDEVVEIITLPKLNTQTVKALEKAANVQLDPKIVSQLKDYLATIAQMYRKNPFHNFEHASHVTMSANKLLNRIVTPENVDYDRETNDIASDLHDYTYGITSDPLTQFAVIFSALVHDVDHTGVPNGQLAKENPDMAIVYRNQSVAEQNSVDLAWELFMDPRYKELQDCIAANDEERKRFRQLVINSVLATDIFDPTMKSLRNKRWDKAFHRDPDASQVINDVKIEEDRNMKATIVIEHIIQASDVAHTMQHWHIYQKWNERLFDEMYSAFECGRAEKNPADGWYKGELWFFDNYVIPLAKKLEECNVFGVASDECLNYAEANRNEWSIKGEETVQEMVQRYHKRKFFVAGMAKKRNPNRKSSRRTLEKV